MRRKTQLQGILFWFLIIASQLLLGGCTLSKQDQYPDTVRVKIPWYSDSQYSLKIVELKTIQNMVQLRGSAARFLLSPTDESGKLIGFEPSIRTFKNQEGIYIPLDSLSAELLALYAHFEKLQNLSDEMGIEGIVGFWNKQKTISVQSIVMDQKNLQMSDNAFYNGHYDAFIFLPYSKQDLPFALNAGVVGHEYFHSIFHRIFGDQFQKNVYSHSHREDDNSEKLTKEIQSDDKKLKTSELYHSLLMRALNEGLADVWGWIYSEDFQFVKKSDPAFVWRDLHQRQKMYYSKEQVTYLANSFLESDMAAYQIAVMYSRSIFSAAQKRIEQGREERLVRIEMAQAITKMLVALKSEFTQLSNNDLTDPLRPLEIFEELSPEYKLIEIERKERK